MSGRMQTVSRLVFIIMIFLLVGCVSGPVVTATSPALTPAPAEPTAAGPGYPAAATLPGEAQPTAGGYPAPGSASTPPAGSELMITRENNGETFTLHPGDRFVLQLGEEYIWTVKIADEAVVGRVVNITPVPGSQGVFEAKTAGATSLIVSGDPPCRTAKPPCSMPSVIVEIKLIVQ